MVRRQSIERRAPYETAPRHSRRLHIGEDVMRNMQWMTAGICAGMLLSASASFADGSPPSTTQSPTAPAPIDKAFLVRALGVNQLELMLGQMAVERAATPEVRTMGEKMV